MSPDLKEAYRANVHSLSGIYEIYIDGLKTLNWFFAITILVTSAVGALACAVLNSLIPLFFFSLPFLMVAGTLWFFTRREVREWEALRDRANTPRFLLD